MARIAEIEGIGPGNTQKLRQAGVSTTNALLEKAASSKGRRELAVATGIEVKLILAWANKADLMRVEGIGPQFTELLNACGVDTIPELCLRDPKRLHDRMVDVNNVKRLVVRVPSVEEVARWIKAAQKFDRVVMY